MDVVVQPGVNWVTLNKTMEDSGLFLPLDPSPTAMIGGMVSTNCSGTNAFRYGTMKDWVINLTVVLADGRVIKTRRRPRKNSAGYNLTSMFVGAEGTLGLVTEVTLKLAVVPQDTSVAVVSFPTIDEAAKAATKLIRSGIQLGALEFLDEVQMQVINRHGSEAVRRTAWDESPTLFLKFSGTTEAIKGDVSRVKDIVQPFKPRKIFFARNKQEEADLWAARKEALWTMTSIKPEGYSLWSTDVAVPISRLAEIITLSKEDSGKLGLFASVIGHVGDGNFHQAVMYDPKNEEQQASVAKCVHDMMSRALEMEGTVSGEHAIGIGKKDCLVEELGRDAIDFMKTLKQAVDPKWIMNPGKVFDLPTGSKAIAAS
ncbi:D-lactate dehydrogenase [cytochrome], mitochondrial [Colletotrichum spaethianum]|uniref:D-lactate dehydrogenase (cytochrome) n=1 Tax=Colletotrichum spaethianum TaxID=700344 RepID=A0AA37L5W2_9PEZI|nr:D-lactate dehydrogenase [cytochrome], mitochondrial [Colletotrichum spaethianum]GKT41199.1 D-lactate dehydrogenase [cytochrome], mitochondrial [Colletotrichum spaethianum]